MTPQKVSKAQRTRTELLVKAFELSYRKGFLQTSLDDILAETHVTKGAFYYHFKNKDEMGVALINELMRPAVLSGFSTMLKSENPVVDTIVAINRFLLFENPDLQPEYGCPAGNFVHEMTPWNESFRLALVQLTDEWRTGLKQLLEIGQKRGELSAEMVPDEVCTYIMSGYWGVRELAKLYNSTNVYTDFLNQLQQYLQKFIV